MIKPLRPPCRRQSPGSCESRRSPWWADRRARSRPRHGRRPDAGPAEGHRPWTEQRPTPLRGHKSESNKINNLDLCYSRGINNAKRAMKICKCSISVSSGIPGAIQTGIHGFSGRSTNILILKIFGWQEWFSRQKQSLFTRSNMNISIVSY